MFEFNDVAFKYEIDDEIDVDDLYGEQLIICMYDDIIDIFDEWCCN